MSTDRTRRSVVAGVAALSVGAMAGCADDPGSNEDGALRIVVNNQRDSTQAVTITVTDADGEVRVDTEDTVSGGVARPYESEGYEDGQYSIRVQGSDWATSSVWQPSTCRNYEFLTRLESGTDGPMVTAESSCSDE